MAITVDDLCETVTGWVAERKCRLAAGLLGLAAVAAGIHWGAGITEAAAVAAGILAMTAAVLAPFAPKARRSIWVPFHPDTENGRLYSALANRYTKTDMRIDGIDRRVDHIDQRLDEVLGSLSDVLGSFAASADRLRERS